MAGQPCCLTKTYTWDMLPGVKDTPQALAACAAVQLMVSTGIRVSGLMCSDNVWPGFACGLLINGGSQAQRHLGLVLFLLSWLRQLCMPYCCFSKSVAAADLPLSRLLDHVCHSRHEAA